MTDQMEPVDEATQYRRRIDDTIARFSAAHDEWEAEEEKRQQRRSRITAGPAKLIEQTRTRLQRVAGDDDPAAVGSDSDRGSVERDSDDVTRIKAAARTDENRSRVDDEAPRKDSEHRGDEDSDPDSPREHDNRRSPRAALAAKICACLLAVLVFLGTATAWGAKQWFNSAFNDVAALNLDSEAIHNGAIQRGDENFLIVGSDTRQGIDSQGHIGSAAQIPGARSDSVMLVHIPEDRHRVVVVSFLRDLEIHRPPCQRWNAKTGKYTGKTVPAAQHAKLNTAYAVGGPKCLTTVIQRITHMPIQHFVGVNFDGFQKIVSAVGGVKVNVERPIIDRELGTVVPEAGETLLKGNQALKFMRARKVEGDPTAGYGRIDRQQKFIGALLGEMMSKDVLLDLDKLGDLVSAFIGATFGDNVGVNQLVTLGRSMQKMHSGDIKFLTVPTTGTANVRGNEVLLEQQADKLFQALMHGRPLPDKQQASTAASAAQSSKEQ